MSWHIEHKDGRTSITHNGKEVRATVLDFHAEVGSFPTAKMEIVFLNDDCVSLQMKEVTVIEKDVRDE